MLTPRQKQELYILLNALCEDTITDEEFVRLNDWVKSNPEVCRLYVKFTAVWSDLQFFQASLYSGGQPGGDSIQKILSNPDCCTDSAIWKALADAENKAPAVKVQPAEAPKVLIEKVQRQKIDRPIRKSSILSLFAAAAAVLLFFVFARYAPIPSYPEVATLADSISAKWSDAAGDMEKGQRLRAGEGPLRLAEGLATLQFDNNTQVVIEAPAEFQILTEETIRLRYGKLCATVPQEAIGFTVNTQTARVIDLGTVFGVQADISGDTSLHVLQGKTTLIAGNKLNKTSVQVDKNSAKKVAGDTQAVQDIPCNDHLFVRHINSAYGTTWRGQKRIYLTDIVSGGTGFETVERTDGIDLRTGRIVPSSSEIVGGDRGNGYVSVPDNPFVDGVFVPDGGQGPVQVSSAGHTFADFGDTGGVYYIPIGASHRIQVNYQNTLVQAELFLKEYASTNACTMCLHANAGITFDLQKIRDRYPVRIRQFSTAYGISWNDSARTSIASDFFVLVDGQPRMVSKNVSEADGGKTVVIPLDDTDRFLTLACTEGGENAGDWALFVNPVLDLE